MSWSGGTYTRTNGTYSGATVWASDKAAAVNIVASRHDTHDQDLATGINSCLNKDGQNSPTTNISWGGFKITSLAAATVAGDAVRYEQVFGAFQPLDAGLTSIAGLTTAADKGIYTTALDVYAVYTLTAGGRALAGVAGTADTFPYFSASNTVTLGALTAGGRAIINNAGTANTFPYYSSSNTVTLGSITAAGLAILDDADAAAQRVTLNVVDPIVIAASDESTALTTGTAKVTFRMPYAMTLTGIKASLTTAQTAGSLLTVDVNEGGTTILSTKLTFDNNEKTTVTAATQPVISDSALAADAEITIDIDQVGTSGAKGLKVTLLGRYLP